MPRQVRSQTLLLLGFAFIAASVLPPVFASFAGSTAFAQGNGGDNGNGGGNGGGGGGDNGNGGGNGNSGGGGNSSAGGNGNGNAGGNSFAGASGNASAARGQSATAPGHAQSTSSLTGKAAAAAPQLNQAKPKAVVRQYVIENGLKQGDVAKALKSWNSLNRNMQAYVANLDNPKSLPGLQLAYVNANLTARTDLAIFTSLGGDPAHPPTSADLAAAQEALSAQQVLDAEAVLADPESSPEELVAAQAIVDAYTGDPQAVVDQFAADYDFAPQTIIDQYNAWTTYQAAEVQAQDAFMAASVSYKGTYSTAAFGELRSTVDQIIAKKGLDTLATP